MLWILPALFLLLGSPANAQETLPVASLETTGQYAIVMEAETGKVLFAKEAEARMPTSSMSKVLTMYLVFEAIEKGALRLDQEVTISSKAAQEKGSRMFVQEGSSVLVEDLVRGVIVQSGNDAAVALAEALAGSETGFAAMMNEKAKQLGLTGSHFVNASGMPDPEHYSTPRDLALLAQALIRDFPQYYHYYSEKSFTYNKIQQGNRNPLLYRNIGVDGVKTGHTEGAGYGLIASALRDGRRVISVINGLKTMQERADESARLLDWAYQEYDTVTLVNKDEASGLAPIWLGQKESVAVYPAKSVRMTLPRAAIDKVKIEKFVAKETEAPVKKGQVVGKIVVIGPDVEPIETQLVAAEDVLRLGVFKVAYAKFLRFMERF